VGTVAKGGVAHAYGASTVVLPTWLIPCCFRATGFCRPAMAVGVLRSAMAVGVLRPAMAVGVLRPAMAVGVLRPAMAVGVLRPAMAVGVLRSAMAVGVLRPSMAVGVLRHVMAARRLQPPRVERWRRCPRALRAHRWLGIGRRRAVRRRGRRPAAEHSRCCSRPAGGTGGKLQSARLGLGLQPLRSRAPWSHMRCSSWLVAVCNASCSATRAVTLGRARSSAQPYTQGSAHCPHWNVAWSNGARQRAGAYTANEPARVR
jgi:hypothetical protein